MRKILNVTLLLLFTIVSCTQDVLNENNQIEKTKNLLSREVSKQNLFDEIIELDLENIVEFSQTIADLNLVQRIQTTDIAPNSIKFKVESKLLILNGVDTYISSRNYEISKNSDSYTLEDDSQDFTIILDTKNSEYFIKRNQNIENINSLIGQQIDPEIERNIPIFLYLIDEFTKKGIDRSFTHTNVAGRKYKGTGVGFHTNLSDAQQFCQDDYNQILEDNPGWWSTGISYSCGWGEHFCMCTANFYTN